MNRIEKHGINPFLHNKLPFSIQQRIITLRPLELLSPDRFDVIAKYIYVKYKEYGFRTDWGKTIYSEHIRAFTDGTFVERDGSGKTSLDKYLHRFHQLIDSIRQNGFDKTLSLLPITKDKEIIDGSHRLSASLFFDKEVSCLEFDTVAAKYNYDFFVNRGLSSQYCDCLALEYCRLNTSSYVVTVFPVAEEKEKRIIDILSKHGSIFYRKDIFLTERGLWNLMRQLYWGEPWAGDYSNHFPGERHKARWVFKKDKPVRVYVITADSIENVLMAKQEIRAIFGLGNNSVHTTDERDETIRIAEQLLSANTIHLFNNSTYIYDHRFESLVLQIKEWIANNNFNKDNFCVDGSSVLCVYGIRPAADLDILHSYYPALDANNRLINSHNQELKAYNLHEDDIVHNPENHFYYNGLKFTSIELLRRFKLVRNEIKDKTDVILINKHLNKKNNACELVKKSFFNSVLVATKRKDLLVMSIKKLVPHRYRPLFLKAKNTIKRIGILPELLLLHLGPIEKQRYYLGFKIFYPRGCSLITRVFNNNIYEPNLSSELLRELLRTQSQYFLDVGANIGLISLNVLFKKADIVVFAIESDPLPSRMFEKTIKENSLEGKIQLFRIAFSNHGGNAESSIHKTSDASADGFRDTAGVKQTTTPMVDTTTVDQWWITVGAVNIKVMRVGAEGAELMILKGGNNFIRCCRPTIFLEIAKKHLHSYPYNEFDILNWFAENHYQLRLVNGALITNDNIEHHLSLTHEFMATPQLL